MYSNAPEWEKLYEKVSNRGTVELGAGGEHGEVHVHVYNTKLTYTAFSFKSLLYFPDSKMGKLKKTVSVNTDLWTMDCREIYSGNSTTDVMELP